MNYFIFLIFLWLRIVLFENLLSLVLLFTPPVKSVLLHNPLLCYFLFKKPSRQSPKGTFYPLSGVLFSSSLLFYLLCSFFRTPIAWTEVPYWNLFSFLFFSFLRCYYLFLCLYLFSLFLFFSTIFLFKIHGKRVCF